MSSARDNRIDYERAVADFETGLVDTLRGFGSADEYLELWVHDDNPVVSLCSMIDAAGTAGHDSIAVFIGAETAQNLDQDRLLAAAGKFGQVRLEADGDGLSLDVTDILKALKEPAGGKHAATTPTKDRPRKSSLDSDGGPGPAPPPNWADGASYADAIREAGRDITREGDVTVRDALVRIEAEDDGVRLRLLIDPEQHIIRETAHQGTANDEDRAVLERFCRLIEGKPIQEASDHGAIRLEYDLRGRTGVRPAPGIFTTKAIQPSFSRPLRLIRSALADYRQETSYEETGNDHDDTPSPEWLALDDAARRVRLNEVIAEIATDNGFLPDEMEVVAIEFDVRVVLRFQGTLESMEKQRYMMILERGVKERIDERLELYQEELKDDNVLRRLSGTEEPS